MERPSRYNTRLSGRRPDPPLTNRAAGSVSYSAPRSQLRTPPRTLAYLFWLSIYFLAKPFYVFPSGLPQPAEGILLCLLVSILTSAPIHWRTSTTEVLFWGFLFFGYACVVNLVWGYLLNDSSIAFTSMFYVFNGITLFVTIYVIELCGRKALFFIFVSGLLSTFIQTVCSFLFHNTDSYGARILGFFENPNQLGYWSVLYATIIFITQKRCNINVIFSLIPVLCLAYLSFISLSRGALIAFFALFIIHFMFHSRLYSVFIVCCACAFLILNGNFIPDVILSLGHGKYDSLESRGYHLIWEYWQYLLFGAGEGGWLYRFNRIRELHSTFGTIIFCYGAIGMSIFIYFMIKIFRASGLVYTLYLLPAFLYGLGHQGLRFTPFWVLVGIVATIGIVDADDVKREQEI